MTSPFSSNLLQQSSQSADDVPVEDGTAASSTTAFSAPGRRHERSVTHVVPAPAPAAPMAPAQPVLPAQVQPVIVHAPRTGGAAAAVSALALGLIVVLVGAVALIGGYYATRQAAPTAEQASIETSLAHRDGYLQGRERGLGQGRADGVDAALGTARLRAATQRQAAWDAAYQRGRAAGERSYRRPRATRGYRGYAAPRISYPRYSETAAAIGAAQQIANATGAPVDIQVFN